MQSLQQRSWNKKSEIDKNVLREEVYMKNKKATRVLALALCAAMLTGYVV